MKTRFSVLSKPAALCVFLFGLSTEGLAAEYSASGFFSIVAGNVLSGQKGEYLENVSGYDCPCFIADYPNAGVYEGNQWDLAPDSRAGIQLKAMFTETFGFTTQVVGHGGDNMKPELSAMYFSYDMNNNLTLNVGRLRLPLFAYSDFYDVGYAYPWIRVPGDLYGWPVSYFNGANITYSDDLGDGTYRISVFAGGEKDKDNREYSRIYYAAKSYTTEWKEMTGASLSYSYDWFDARVVYMTNKVFGEANYGASGGGRVVDLDYFNQQFLGVSFNVDYENVLVKTEYNQFDIFKTNFNSDAKLVSAGYRIGEFTPMLTYTRYDDVDPDFGEAHSSLRSLSIRWDFMKSTAFKMQYDIVIDNAKWLADDTVIPPIYYKHFTGNTRTLSVGVDYVF